LAGLPPNGVAQRNPLVLRGSLDPVIVATSSDACYATALAYANGAAACLAKSISSTRTRDCDPRTRRDQTSSRSSHERKAKPTRIGEGYNSNSGRMEAAMNRMKRYCDRSSGKSLCGATSAVVSPWGRLDRPSGRENLRRNGRIRLHSRSGAPCVRYPILACLVTWLDLPGWRWFECRLRLRAPTPLPKTASGELLRR
jgi:hypothetical protein